MTQPRFITDPDIRVIALVRGPERYVFLWDGSGRDQLLQTLGRFAARPELSFNWRDAAVLGQRIRQEEEATR